MRARLMILLLAAMLLGAGCARAFTETSVNADGSGSRTVTFTLSKGMDDQPLKLANTFKVPTGSGVKVSEKPNAEGDLVVTVTRPLAADSAPFTDLELKEKDGIRLKNLVSVRKLPDGNLEYTETITWVGKSRSDFSRQNEELIKLLPKVIPADLATPPLLAEISNASTVSVMRLMFGPNEPMILMLITHPEFALRKFKNRFSKNMDQILEQKLGDKMDAAARKTAIRKLVELLDAQTMMQNKEKAGQEANDDKTGLTSFTFSAKMPGEVIETNGELDEYSGEVMWSMFGEGAQAGPVTLRAVCKPGS